MCVVYLQAYCRPQFILFHCKNCYKQNYTLIYTYLHDMHQFYYLKTSTIIKTKIVNCNFIKYYKKFYITK